MKGLESFNKLAKERYPFEASGILFQADDEWKIINVKVIDWDWDADEEVKNLDEFNPNHSIGFHYDKKDWARAKRIGKKNNWRKLGVIHSHPILNGHNVTEEVIDDMSQPSDVDLKYARKWGGIRGIVVIGLKEGGPEVLRVRFHDADNNDIEEDTCLFCGKELKDTSG